MMDGNELISRMVKLKDISSSKDIPQLSYAMFPGMHCPLFGATMSIRGIKDAVMLVVGTDECSYYSKHFSIRSDAFGGLGGRCVSAVLDTRDITFGCKNMLDEAVEELVTEYRPRAVFIVTTCVVEVIGDDTDSMAEAYTKKYGLPFISVHTEHFKCENHMPGVERTMTSCFGLMKEKPVKDTCNVIGQRMGIFDMSELAKLLKEVGTGVTMQLPSKCTVEDIENAAEAKVNILVDPTGLPLALKMKEEFNTPYVEFYRMADPDDILNCYKELFACLGKPLPEKVTELYEKAVLTKEKAKEQLSGVTYIYGNTVFYNFELNSFMVSLGMKPLIIQTVAVDWEKDKRYLDNILSVSDPFVVKPANIAPLQYVYDVMHPDLYMGHESAVNLAKKGIALVRSDQASLKLGFELTEFMAEELERAASLARKYRNEVQ